ncbi:peptidase domain-containing ABC transporter [Pseudomonas benzenivorans]|uniref:ATP-binding cassette domain-containing protein n=1 Tax=Pseudomonas benzenivorans TaxID=556533 RepID=A0ABY5H4T2_9PSED|nr:ATP-binding cassette domain-containing protein [Pseudomonas benzenivorans]UTW07210.1 ATP-binding cassette domain-containing protein [Pseudomonas benzenivorans]
MSLHETPNADGAAPGAAVEGKAPPAALLHQLLAQLNVSADLQALHGACAKAEQSLPAVQPAERVRFILTQVQLKGVQPIQLAWRRFDLRRLPALVLHEDVWYRAERHDGDNIALTDAAGARQTVAESELQSALVLWLRPPAQRSKSTTPSLKGNLAARLVWRELFREPAWVAKVLTATVIVNLLAISTSLFAMQVYDRVVPTLAYSTLTTLVAGMGLIILLDWGLKILRARIVDSVSVAVDKRVSQQVFDHLLHLRLDIQPKSLGTLAAQVGGLDSVRQFFSAGVIFGLIDLPFALMFIAFIALIGGQVGWVYALLLPVALLLGLTTQVRLRDLLRRQLQRHNERQGVLVDTIRGAESIRANNATWRFSEEWQAITASIDGYSIQQKAINSFSSVTTGSLSTLAYVAAVVVGVWQIEVGLLTMGGLIACSILGGRVIAPIAQGVQYLTQWQNVSQSLQMVNQVLSLDLERRADQHLLLPESPPQTLELEKVRFAYPESPVQQVNVANLSLRAGERVLLVGPVGCGKSTLLKVLAGLYRPHEGRVRLGDADLWEIDPQVVAGHLGYLPQSVHLFKGTLRSNLALSGTVGDSRLLKVTRDLGVDAIAASSPLGMDHSISEGGEGLSGGQRQLVALARVVIAQPRIWLLDEPTASLDAESEAKVWQVLEENLRPEDILIVSTHRPMLAMKLATRVILMQQGEVVKDGKPESVMPQLLARAAINRPADALPARKYMGGAPDVV